MTPPDPLLPIFGAIAALLCGTYFYRANLNNGNCAMGAFGMLIAVGGLAGLLNALLGLCRLMEACQ